MSAIPARLAACYAVSKNPDVRVAHSAPQPDDFRFMPSAPASVRDWRRVAAVRLQRDAVRGVHEQGTPNGGDVAGPSAVLLTSGVNAGATP